MKHEMKPTLPVIAGIVAVCTVTSHLAGADWPRFRGPDGLGVSAETDLPTKWSNTENVAWKLELPGWGNSSPAVVGERIYLTAQTDDKAVHVLCVDRSKGKLAWSKRVGSGSQKAHQLHNMATPTPVADDRRVWALFGTGLLACLDRQGELLWKRDIQKEHGKYTIQWGMGTSPALHAGRVYLACMQNGGASYLLAVDGTTGKDVWKTERKLDSVGEARDSYSTPILVRPELRAAQRGGAGVEGGENQGGAQLVLCGADHVDAYDPKSGKQIWLSSGLQVPHPYGRSIASPTFADGVVVAVASGFQGQGHLLAVKTGGTGDVTKSHRLWEYKKHSPDCPTPVSYRGLLYVIRDNGVASCLDLKTGEVHWQERLFKANVKVSPVAGDGKIYFPNGDGNCKVIEAGPELKVLAENDLEETMLATPAISDGQIYLRTKERLYAVGK